MKKILLAALLMLSSVSYAETMSGPRLGFTYLSPGITDMAAEEDIEIDPVITQFGWQFEEKFLTTSSGPEGVTALIPLIGATEQNLFLPSLTWLIGLRMPSGYEFAMGPNLSVGGSGMAFTVGHTSKLGELFMPKNLSVVVSKEGFKFSFLFGFNSEFED